MNSVTDTASAASAAAPAPRHITLGTLPLENLRRKPLRTAALIAVVFVMALAFFGGTMLASNLKTGMASMEERLGADLMVTPQNTGTKAEALITNGNPSTFYFTSDIAATIATADGVAESTEQTYIASLTADCCDEKLQIIGFNPSTDFVLEPWIASQYSKTLEDGQMIAGANVNVSTNGTIELYGRTWPVVVQLASTGTSLDNSVFISQNTVPQMVQASIDAGNQAMPKEYADKAVSSVLIKVADGYSAEKVAENIQKLDSRFTQLGYVYPGGITATTRTALNTLVGYVRIFVALLCVMGIIVLIAVFCASVNERKREFASLRIMGATRGALNGIAIKEAIIIGLVGGVLGVAVASLIIFPFSTLIARQLELPYLQASPGIVVFFALLTVLAAVVLSVLGSLIAMARIGRPEAYLTLREGE